MPKKALRSKKVKWRAHGKQWCITFLPKIKCGGEPLDGVCFYADYEIQLSTHTHQSRRIAIVIHEGLHALFPDLRDSVVDKASAKLAKLIKLSIMKGYIK